MIAAIVIVVIVILAEIIVRDRDLETSFLRDRDRDRDQKTQSRSTLLCLVHPCKWDHAHQLDHRYMHVRMYTYIYRQKDLLGIFLHFSNKKMSFSVSDKRKSHPTG